MAEHYDESNIYEEVQEEAKKDLASQVAGVLSALIPVLAILGINFDWFNQEFVDSIYVLIGAIITLVVNVVTIVKNHFVTDKEKLQKKVIKERGLEK